MFGLVPGHQASRRSHDAPPGQSRPPRENVADGSRRTGEACLFRHLAVGRDLSWLQRSKNATHALLEFTGQMNVLLSYLGHERTGPYPRPLST